MPVRELECHTGWCVFRLIMNINDLLDCILFFTDDDLDYSSVAVFLQDESFRVVHKTCKTNSSVIQIRSHALLRSAVTTVTAVPILEYIFFIKIWFLRLNILTWNFHAKNMAQNVTVFEAVYLCNFSTAPTFSNLASHFPPPSQRCCWRFWASGMWYFVSSQHSLMWLVTGYSCWTVWLLTIKAAVPLATVGASHLATARHIAGNMKTHFPDSSYYIYYINICV